jgi:hypothetical protein
MRNKSNGAARLISRGQAYSSHDRRTCARLEQPSQQPQQCRLPRPVRAEYRHAIASPNSQIHAIYRHPPAESALQAIGFDRVPHRTMMQSHPP